MRNFVRQSNQLYLLMTIISSLYLLSLSRLLRIELLVWVVGVPLIALAVAALIYQQYNKRRLKNEMDHYAKIKRHAIEYDLVLKAMKLSVWRIDVPTRTITFESDYREVVGLPIFAPGSSLDLIIDIMKPESREQIISGIRELENGHLDEFHGQYEMLLQHGEGSCWGELCATVDQRDVDGHPLTIVGTSMNIDHRKEIEQALIDSRYKAEESDRLKSAFLANMSHEVRTPLNAIVGFSEVLPMAQSEEERESLIALIKQNNAHLLRLFEDMVSMSRLEAGVDAANKTHFNLSTLLKEQLDRFTPDYEKKGIALRVEGDTDILCFSDYDRLREILNQYLNNALKFTEKGSVTMGCDIMGDRLRLWVCDTGKGIPAEYCNNRLFERFVKVDDFIAGTGLGLSICRGLAISIDGTVGVESKEGEGSLFWVEIAKE